MLQTSRLDAEATTILFAWTDGVPEIVYLGARLADDVDIEHFSRSRARPLAQATLDEAAPVSMQPEIARGFMGHPGLIAYRRGWDQPGWAGLFNYDGHEFSDHAVAFICTDAHRGLALEIACRLDPQSSVAVFTSRLINQGDAPLHVEWLSAPVLPIAPHYSEYFHFHGRWCAEFAIERREVPLGLVKTENRRGRTSHEAFPGTIMMAPTTDEESGPCLGVHLGWSGNHRFVLERLASGECQLQAGVLHFSQEGTIPPGGFLSSPELFAATSERGLNRLSQKFHAHVRHAILKLPEPAKPRPVTVNTWEALYFDHTPEKLTALADAAARVGAERYVLDDGWFRGRNDDTTSLGDWYPDPQKYPYGLKPIADYVTSLGMEFGLWVEPEMVNPDSDLFRAHPDWVLGLLPYPQKTGRNQLVLDLTNDSVFDYLFGRLADLLGTVPISCLKWDMNRDLVLPGDRSGHAAVHRQTLALYRLLDALRAEFPMVEIESCASGGGRIDFEILKRTHRFWTSDSNDAVERMRIQNGFSYFFPPEIMGAHIGPTWCHTTGRGFRPGFRSLVAGYGHMGLELDLRSVSEADMAVFAKAVERHKEDRSIWHGGKFHRLKSVDPNLFGALAVSEDKASARAIITQIDRPRSAVPPPVQLPGLDPRRRYRVTVQAGMEELAKANRRFDNPLAGDGVDLPGAVLCEAGLQLPVLYAQTGVALSLEAVA